MKSTEFKPKRARKGKISFDVEVINKNEAEKLLSEQDTFAADKNDAQEPISIKKVPKKRKQSERETKNIDSFKAKKKITMEKQAVTENKGTVETESTEGQDAVKQPKKESVRARKRKKHLKLLEEKKLNSDLQLQQKALNYLSKWKHSRSEWKFEKLKQVWIQQSLLDSSKIPNEFWKTALEYFGGTKGSSRQTALDAAIKIIEAEGETSEEGYSEESQIKLNRARDIVQYLQ